MDYGIAARFAGAVLLYVMVLLRHLMAGSGRVGFATRCVASLCCIFTTFEYQYRQRGGHKHNKCRQQEYNKYDTHVHTREKKNVAEYAAYAKP